MNAMALLVIRVCVCECNVNFGANGAVEKLSRLSRSNFQRSIVRWFVQPTCYLLIYIITHDTDAVHG